MISDFQTSLMESAFVLTSHVHMTKPNFTFCSFEMCLWGSEAQGQLLQSWGLGLMKDADLHLQPQTAFPNPASGFVWQMHKLRGLESLALTHCCPLKCNGKERELWKAALINKGGLGNDAKDGEGNGGKTLGHQHVLWALCFNITSLLLETEAGN